ncbi:MAG: hypothetical protein IKG21_11225 [Atopobiaceae bacterium]|nr:hypothetical protein [Atopobiaceae bacterium]
MSHGLVREQQVVEIHVKAAVIGADELKNSHAAFGSELRYPARLLEKLLKWSVDGYPFAPEGPSASLSFRLPVLKSEV